jgi:23S rRNA (guanosine2251-2'-O)-methyltransferase
MENLTSREKQEMIYGTRPVIEAIRSGEEIDKILIQKGLRGENFPELMAELKARSIPYQFVPFEKLKRVTRKNHQGVIAYVAPVHFAKVEDVLPGIFESGRTPFLVLMDRITDVRNFGAILRTAEGAGVDAVVIPARNSAQLNAGTVKSSAGAIFKVPICRSQNLKETIEFLKESGLQIISASEKADKDLYEIDFSVPVAIVLGSEGEGVSEAYIKLSGDLVKIPMKGEIASLNVSVAAGVIFYEVVRQRQSS